MRIDNFFFSVCLFFTALPFTAQAQHVVEFPPAGSISLWKDSYFLEDTTAALTAKDILQPIHQNNFRAGVLHRPNFGITNSAVWCKFQLTSQTDETAYFSIGFVNINRIEFYQLINDSLVLLQKSGTAYPFFERSINRQPFLKEIRLSSVPQSFYVRLSTTTAMPVSLNVDSEKSLLENFYRIDVVAGIYIGILLVILIYNLIIFFGTNDRVYLYYSLCVFFTLWFQGLIVSGIGFSFVWPRFPQINFWGYGIVSILGIFLVKFSTTFLESSKRLPKLHLLSYLFYAFFSISFVFNLFGNSYWVGPLVSGLLAVCCVYLFILGCVSYFKGVRNARFYLAGWVFYLLGTLLYLLSVTGLILDVWVFRNGLMLGSSSEVILLSVAIADRVNVIRNENRMLELRHNEEMANRNLWLEKMVQQRTGEISAQNEEMAQQQEEMAAQRDKVEENNRSLSEAKQIIEIQNEQIKAHNALLEDQVRVRAEQLLEANQQLVQHNSQLEQFAFMSAHNLRAPVARILGLANILDRNQINEESRFIIDKIVGSSIHLDSVIKDLNQILELKKLNHVALEEVDLQEKIDRVLLGLQPEIEESKASIVMDFNAFSTVHSFGSYIESIFYNLINNAIKYRNPKTPLVIKLETKRKEKVRVIEISDTGLGFDMAQSEEKLFGLYKRFHTHVEGKGIGLYIVKTQITILGGDITVQSQQGVGTTFTISLPDGKR